MGSRFGDGENTGTARRGGAALGAVVALVTLLALAGCATQVGNATTPTRTAAVTPTPTPASTSAPDLSMDRSFTLGDGTTAEACLTVSVKLDGAARSADGNRRVDAARAILAQGRWRTEPVSLTEVPASELQVMKDRGETDAVILAGVLRDHIQAALTQAGITEGIVTSGYVGCR